MRKYLVVLTLLSSGIIYACGTSSTTDDGGTDAPADNAVNADVGSDTSPLTDASVDVKEGGGIPTCTQSNPFATPVILSTLNLTPDAGGAQRGGHLTTDYLSAFYQYQNALYSASRTSPSGDTFGTPTELSVSMGLPDASTQNSSPTLSSDALTMFFASDRSGISQIYIATRTSTSASFGTPAIVSGLPTNVALTSPFLQGDGSTLWFLNAGQIYRAPITNNTVGAPAAVAELNAGGAGPIAVTADGLTAYFSRVELPDGGSSGHFKVWTASRASTAAQFGNIAPVPVLNGPDGVNDDITWVSNDGCEVMLSSFRDPGSNLYIAVKP